ncbi:UPF0651 protein P31B10.02, mitochondrial [Prosopis cineraria]|uniref:UPF0651 protein P31B10.02, mitochondrial n=1 Tax=Prosopis cineraria TaxID=364024 RepID=UPI00240ECF65|nr:UPF0651 protein P31B10.02, mitochondrial [Prosopis cineraria]
MCCWSTHAKSGNCSRFDCLLKAEENVAAMRAGAGGGRALRRVSSNFIVLHHRLRDPRPFFAQPIFNPKFMAQKADSLPIRSELEADGKKDKDSVMPPKEAPPPPEKPLPGDCCGSGCVRCVWDVYYEELEEYNKLCKQNHTPKP